MLSARMTSWLWTTLLFWLALDPGGHNALNEIALT